MALSKMPAARCADARCADARTTKALDLQRSSNREAYLAQCVGVIAGEPEDSWRAGGQQEGLQYNREAA